MKRLSIIIPVYNEESTIKEVLKRVKNVKLRGGLAKEIIVVDDSSKDKSLEIIKSIKGIKILRHKINKGKGAAVKTGMVYCTGEIIIVQDADLEYNPKDFNKLIRPIHRGEAKVVYGTRLRNYPLKIFGVRKTPLLLHYFGNKFLTLATNILYGEWLTDMETCYKVFTSEVIDGMKINSSRFEFEPELTAKILKRGYKIHEIPIKVKPRGYEEGKKITWRDGFIALWTLIKYRFVD